MVKTMANPARQRVVVLAWHVTVGPPGHGRQGRSDESRPQVTGGGWHGTMVRTRRAVNNGAYAGSDPGLSLASPAEDRQLHAGHDGVPDAVLPRRPVLGRRARQGGGRRRRRRRQPHVHRAGRLADARRRHDDAGVARGGQRNQARALLVFNQSQVLSMVVGGLFLVDRDDLADLRTPTALSADAATAATGRRLPALVHPGDGAAVLPSWRWASALRGIGNFKPGMVVQTATVIINMVLAPFLIFGWGTGYAMGVAGAAIATLDRRRGRRRVAGHVLLVRVRRSCASSARTCGRSSRCGGTC